MSGWGVIYSERMLDVLFRADPTCAREIRTQSVFWQEQEWQLHGRSAYLPRERFALERPALMNTLVQRAVELGAEVEFGSEVQDPASLGDADLVVAADGVGSRVRRQFAEQFGTTIELGRNRYMWLGTDHVFPHMTFPFQRTAAGWIWMHAYPSSRRSSTCVVECPPETWQGLGLDVLPVDEGLRLLAEVFAAPLHGRPLLGRSAADPGSWQRFQHLTNRTWWHEKVVLVGDAAHAAHFTSASGTRLAMADAAALADCLARNPDLTGALTEYDQRRRERVNRAVERSRRRAERWEHRDEVLERDVLEFVYAKGGHRDDTLLRRMRPLYRAGQLGVVRAARRQYGAARRWYRDRRQASGDDGSAMSAAAQPARRP
jgi:2-polyprenyl-6-methoxyphenol hydroxylase-like FAD-dependent oxidoreductase